MAASKEIRAAVIGAGSSGLSMLKTLTEDGLKTTLFERRKQVGGIWAYSEDKRMTSTLPTTKANISKYTCGMSDYPMPDKYPHYLTQTQFQDYMQGYAEHFDLLKHIVFNAFVKQVVRNPEDTKWLVQVEIDGEPQSLEFDKVVFCHGYQTKAEMPEFEGRKAFAGPVIHSQQFREIEPFKDKKVVLVGIGSTADDVVQLLLPLASKLYISHRRGMVLFKRWRNGTPADLSITYRRKQMAFFIQKNFPGLAKWMADKAVEWYIPHTWGKLDPTWRFQPFPSTTASLPGSSEVIIPSLRTGELTSLHGIKRFLGPTSIEFDDGTVLDDIDAVICCTGYEADFSVAPFLETSRPTNYDGPEMVRMYMNMFPPKYANSMALLCHSAFGKGNGFSFNDLTSMAVSNVFRGVHQLPPKEVMEKHIDNHHEWVASKWRVDKRTAQSAVKVWEFQPFMHDAAGTGLENLGWGWKGWKFFFQDPKLSYLLNHGVDTAHAYRVFETGKRKAWPGARDAIIHMNELAKGFPIKEEEIY